jgi:drug/metabolite transporter (DMT)-like permease
MNAGLIALVAGVTAAVSYGFADFLAAKASKKLGPIASALSVQTAQTVIFCTGYLLFIHGWPQLSPAAWGYVLSSSALMALGLCALYIAFEIGPVSLASPLGSAYPLVAALAGVVAFGTKLTLPQLIGIVLLVSGTMLIAGLVTAPKSERHLTKGPMMALSAALLWGLSYALLGQAIDEHNWQAVTLVQQIAMAAVLGIVALLARNYEAISPRGLLSVLRSRFIIGAGTVQVLAVVAINIGFSISKTTGTEVVAISSTYPLLTVALALYHFEERLTLWSAAGIAATIGGTILVVSG